MENKEIVNSTSSASIVTSVEEINEKNKTIRPPLFLMFAEFLGYKSELIEWADTLCRGIAVPAYINNAIKLEAKNIFTMMKTDFTIDEIKKFWDSLYQVVLSEYEDNLNDLENFPF